MCKCLYCYKELKEGEKDFHPRCAKLFFGTPTAPQLPYTRDNMHELAECIIRQNTTVTGVQAKMSLDVDRGDKGEPAKFTIVGLWGKYIFKPESSKYRCLPELEDLTMKMAEAAKINTVPHTLIRLKDGEMGYMTKRVDRGEHGERYSMLDFCQLSNRLTEHKYDGTYVQLAEAVKRYSAVPLLDVQRYWEIVLFSWITGNSDMHCKNFSLLSFDGRSYRLSPAYDLLAVCLADINDKEEMAMTFKVGGKKTGFNQDTFLQAFQETGIPYNTGMKIIARMKSHKEKWFALIDKSFLPDELKTEYKQLLESRLKKI